MRNWQDWNGDGKVSDLEKAFTFYMVSDMNKRAGKSGGCLSCILFFLVAAIGTVSMIIH